MFLVFDEDNLNRVARGVVRLSGYNRFRKAEIVERMRSLAYEALREDMTYCATGGYALVLYKPRFAKVGENYVKAFLSDCLAVCDGE